MQCNDGGSGTEKRLIFEIVTCSFNQEIARRRTSKEKCTIKASFLLGLLTFPEGGRGLASTLLKDSIEGGFITESSVEGNG